VGCAQVHIKGHFEVVLLWLFGDPSFRSGFSVAIVFERFLIKDSNMLTLEQAQDWYPSDDPVHGFDHIIRVYRLAERIGKEENADLEIVRAAVLLHDVAGEHKGGERNKHQYAAAVFAGEVLASEEWKPEKISAVQHCIKAHRFRDNREKPSTIEAMVVFDADKLDAIGAIGVIRAVAYAVQAGAALIWKPSQSFIETGVREPNEPYTPYHEYIFKLRNIKECMFTKAGKKIAEERHQYMENFFDQLSSEVEGKR